MTKETEEALTAVAHHTNKALRSARAARKTTTEPGRKIMLGGKMKGYTETLCFIRDRWGVVPPQI